MIFKSLCPCATDENSLSIRRVDMLKMTQYFRVFTTGICKVLVFESDHKLFLKTYIVGDKSSKDGIFD